MELKIKLLKGGQMPTKGTSGAACYDIYAAEDYAIDNNVHFVSTGLSVEIPSGYCMHIYPRSGLSSRGVMLANCVAVIDCDYRGEIKLPIYALEGYFNFIKKGDRIAQFSIDKVNDFNMAQVQELSATQRGTGGFGSTGV